MRSASLREAAPAWERNLFKRTSIARPLLLEVYLEVYVEAAGQRKIPDLEALCGDVQGYMMIPALGGQGKLTPQHDFDTHPDVKTPVMVLIDVVDVNRVIPVAGG